MFAYVVIASTVLSVLNLIFNEIETKKKLIFTENN